MNFKRISEHFQCNFFVSDREYDKDMNKNDTQLNQRDEDVVTICKSNATYLETNAMDDGKRHLSVKTKHQFQIL
jgi:hypothetical protein